MAAASGARPPAGSALSLLRSPRATPGAGAGRAAAAAAPAAAPPSRQAATAAAIPPLQLQLAAATSRPAPAPAPARMYCSFNLGQSCRHALATRECLECKRWDRTGTGYHCEACFAARHPWTAVAHTWRLLHQRPPTPPRRAVYNAVAERTVTEAQLLLRRTADSEAALGRPAGAQAPALASAAGKCDELVGRLTTMLLQLRDGEWQARQQAVKRIILCWRGRVWRRWWRTATALVWGKMRDPASGDDFYVNMNTMRTLWVPPVVFGRQVSAASVRRVWPCSLSKQAAAVVLQRWLRGHASRMRTARVFLRSWRTVQVNLAAPQRAVPRPADPTAPFPPTHYYFNVLPEADRLWRAPRVEKPRVLFTLHPVEFGRHPDDQPSVALALAMQTLGRKFSMRMAFFQFVARFYERVWDPDFRRYYYFNKKTGGTQWSKPMAGLLKNFEPPIMKGEEGPGESEANAMGAVARQTASGLWRTTQAAKVEEGEEGGVSGSAAASAAKAAALAEPTPKKGLFGSWGGGGSSAGGSGSSAGGGGSAKTPAKPIHKVEL